MVAWVVSFIAARTLAVPFADVVFKSVEPHAFGGCHEFFRCVFSGVAVAELARSLLSSWCLPLVWEASTVCLAAYSVQ